MDTLSKRTLRNGIILSVVLIFGSLLWRSMSVTMGVVAGAGLSLANFWSIQRIVSQQFAAKKPKFMLGIYILKLGVIFLALYGLIQLAGLEPIAIMAGLTVTVVTGIAGGQKMASELAAEEMNETSNSGDHLNG